MVVDYVEGCGECISCYGLRRGFGGLVCVWYTSADEVESFEKSRHGGDGDV